MYFQNPFAADFSGAWLLSDRQYSVDFKCPRNYGRGDELITVWAMAPYNLSGNDSDGNPRNVLTLSFALNDYKNWSEMPVTITGATQSAVTAQEVVVSLMSNPLFSDRFTAYTDKFDSRNNISDRVVIKQNKDATKFRFFARNTGAETVLLFNKRAGVAELPNYYMRHTVAERFAYPDSQNALIDLNPGTSNVDVSVINNAVDSKGNVLNYSATTIKPDWQLLGGRSGLFQFHTSTFDGSGRPTSTVLYHAGAQVGDMAKKTEYTYSGANTNPATVAEIPYVLTSGDLITPA